MTADFSVHEADWAHERDAVRAVRTRVFVEEQNVPPELEWDGLDARCLHVLARAGGEPVGTGRLTPEGHVGRMAVLRGWRGRGVGKRLLETLLLIASERHERECVLNAQLSATGFYARFGFRAEGGEFMDAGIPHRRMRLALEKTRTLAGHAALRDGLLALARASRRGFSLYAPTLAPRLSDNAKFAEALKNLALSSPRASIRLLTADARKVSRDGHALLRLVDALPSRCALHQLGERDDAEEQVYAFADRGGAFHQPRTGHYTGVLALDTPMIARSLQHRFEPLWQRSESSPETRRVPL